MIAWRRRTLLAALTAAVGALAAGRGRADSAGIGEPPLGKALIVFYRRSIYPDSAISYIVREGKTELGLLTNGSYFVATADPGWHTYTVHEATQSDMQIRIEADEIYYVRFDLDVGFLLYKPTLSPAEQWDFDEIAGQLALSPPLRSSSAPAAAPAP